MVADVSLSHDGELDTTTGCPDLIGERISDLDRHGERYDVRVLPHDRTVMLRSAATRFLFEAYSKSIPWFHRPPG